MSSEDDVVHSIILWSWDGYRNQCRLRGSRELGGKLDPAQNLDRHPLANYPQLKGLKSLVTYPTCYIIKTIQLHPDSILSTIYSNTSIPFTSCSIHCASNTHLAQFCSNLNGLHTFNRLSRTYGRQNPPSRSSIVYRQRNRRHHRTHAKFYHAVEVPPQ